MPQIQKIFSFVYRVDFLWEGTEWGEEGERGTGRVGREREEDGELEKHVKEEAAGEVE